MTALLPSRADSPTGAAIPVDSIGTPRLFAGIAGPAGAPVLNLGPHLAVHGPLTAPGRERLLDWTRAVALAGRGGAGFPFAAKLDALVTAGGRPVVVVNAAESEPASWKDRALLQRAPHLVLDGALAVAGALAASRLVVAVHDRHGETALQQALAERADGRAVEVHRVAGGYVAGEARALVRALDGGPAVPPGRRTPPSTTGAGGAPTLVSNAETFAQLAVLLRRGPARFRDTGTHAQPGTLLVTVAGAVSAPGVIEAPTGTPAGFLLAAAGGGAASRLVLGGYHGTWLPVPADGVALSVGSGAGVLLALDESTCALGELARVAGWLAAQSAGQCGPCRFGLPALAADVDALWRGHAAAQPAALQNARVVTGRGACGHPDGAARFVSSGLAALGDEIDRHTCYGGCGRPVRGLLPLTERTPT